MTTTGIRAVVLALIAVLGFLFPGVIPEDVKEALADNAVQAVSAVLAIWSMFAAHRAVSKK